MDIEKIILLSCRSRLCCSVVLWQMEHTAATLNEICVAIFVAVAASDYDKKFEKARFRFGWSFSSFFIVQCLLFLALRSLIPLDAPRRAAPHVGRAYKAYVIINSMQ